MREQEIILRMSFSDIVYSATAGTAPVVEVASTDRGVTYNEPLFLEQCVGASSSSLVTASAVLDALLLSAQIAANSLVLLCLVVSRAPPSGAPTRAVIRACRRFIANLAAADVFVGVATVYFLVIRYACPARAAAVASRWMCVSRFWLISMAHLTSAFSMAAIAVDRYIAVVHALRYREIMSHRRSCAVLACTWTFPVLIAMPVLFWNRWSPDKPCELDEVVPLPLVAVVGVFTHVSLLFVVGVTHYRVHRVAVAVNRQSSLAWLRRTSSSRNNSTASESTPPPTNIWPSPTATSGDSSPPAGSRRAATKSARTVLLVTGCYFCMWTPYMLIYMTRVIGVTGDAVDISFSLAHSFANLNYLINPFIYAFRNAEVRCAIIRVCKTLVDRKRTSPIGQLSISTIRSSSV